MKGLLLKDAYQMWQLYQMVSFWPSVAMMGCMANVIIMKEGSNFFIAVRRAFCWA